MQGVKMSGVTKAVRDGVRVKLPGGIGWDVLATMRPDEIRDRNLLLPGFMPLPHVKQATGGQVFPPQPGQVVCPGGGRRRQGCG